MVTSLRGDRVVAEAAEIGRLCCLCAFVAAFVLANLKLNLEGATVTTMGFPT